MVNGRDNLATRGDDELVRMHNYLAGLAKIKAITSSKGLKKGVLANKIRELRRKVPMRIVRQASESALLQTDPILTYEEILMRVHAEFECTTSVACLRWYAVRMRERGERVPQRPRVGSK